MRTVVTIQANIPWHAVPSSTSKRWIGVCQPMNLTIEADSLDELHSIIGETMQLTLLDLLQDDELDGFLRTHGWAASNLPQGRRTGEDVAFNVPWELIARGHLDTERRAS